MLRTILACLLVGATAPALAQEAEAPAAATTPSAAQQELDALKVELGIVQTRNSIREERALAIPVSGLTNSATAGAGSGGAESLALAGLQFDRIAQQIVTAVVSSETVGTPIFLTASADYPDFQAATAFDIRYSAVKRQLEALQSFQLKANIVPVLTAATSLLSYLNSTTTLGAPADHTLGDEALMTAILARGNDHIGLLRSGPPPADAMRTLQSEIQALEQLREKLEPARQECATTRATLTADLAEAPEARRPRIRADAQPAINQCDTLDVGLAAYTTFITDYGPAGGDKLATVLKQRAALTQLTPGGRLLHVDVLDTAGGFYTQTNLISALGGMPFHVTTGSVVGWRLIKQDGTVEAADMITTYDGYRQMHEVDILVNGCDAIEVRRHQRLPTLPRRERSCREGQEEARRPIRTTDAVEPNDPPASQAPPVETTTEPLQGSGT